MAAAVAGIAQKRVCGVLRRRDVTGDVLPGPVVPVVLSGKRGAVRLDPAWGVLRALVLQ